MKTHRDLIQRVLESLGIVMPGGQIEPDAYRSASNRLKDYLLELDSEPQGPLDFDPTASDEIPDERMSWLVRLFANQIAPQYGKPVNDGEVILAKSGLFAAIIGESDYTEDVPRDF